MNDAADGVTHAPFNQQVSAARDERGLTQADVAEAVGMSLRAYGDFETGKTQKLQARNRRALMRFFGWDRDPAPADPDDEDDEIAPDIRVFLGQMRAFLETMDEPIRLRWMEEETRRIWNSREVRTTAARIAQDARDAVRDRHPPGIDPTGGQDGLASRDRRAGGSA